MRTVEQEQDTPQRVLPAGVRDALGELAGAAKDGLLALSVGVGLGVLSEMMEAELDEIVGPKHANNAERTAVRHGHEDGEVTLGGRRVAVRRPRARSADDEHEVPLQTYAYFADRDPLTRVVLEQMLAGVSTRRFSRTREPVGEQVSGRERSTSKSAVVALGITTDGVKIPLGLWDGSTENKTVTAYLLADLVDRGLDVEQGVLVVLDGSKALRAAVGEVFGPVPVQRCIRHKERNVLDHLPERDRPVVKARLRRAWASDNHALALDGLRTLASELARSHPGAAASLREGLEETLTLTRLGIHGRLKKTLASTNPIESMIEIIRRTSRNVKRWQSGDMCLRWTAAGMLEAETQFRKVVGYADLAKLALAVERDLLAQRTTTHTTTKENTLIPVTV
jgi:putative transposase